MSTLLTEAISISHLRNPLYTTIKSAILSSVEKVSTMKFDDDLQSGHLAVFQSLENALHENMTNALQQLLEREIDDSISIVFRKMSSNGEANWVDVTINIVYIRAITKSLLDATAQQAMQAKHGWVWAIANYHWEKTDRELVPIVRELVNVIIHELVHVKQALAQTSSGRVKREYRSYVQRDKKKFNDVMNAIKSGNFTDADYIAYRASPQELEAFAHQIAMMFIDNHDDITREIINRDIHDYIDDVFSDLSDKNQRLAFNKLHKLLYKELINYVEHK